MQIIPLTSEPNQFFTLVLQENQYSCFLLRNERMGTWMLSIRDADGVSVIEGQALVLGQKILEPYDLGLGQFAMVDTENTGIDAGEDDLGSRVILLYVTEEELAAGV